MYAFKILNNALTPFLNNYYFLNSDWEMRFALLFQLIFLIVGIVFTILSIRGRFYSNKVHLEMSR